MPRQSKEKKGCQGEGRIVVTSTMLVLARIDILEYVCFGRNQPLLPITGSPRKRCKVAIAVDKLDGLDGFLIICLFDL